MTDALARTDSLYYDDADRPIRQVLPNGSEILYGYDANGNLTSLTPPGRPAHGLAYDAADQDSFYAPPPLGAGSWSTEYRYDVDQQFTRVIRPDGQEIALGYDFPRRQSGMRMLRWSSVEHGLARVIVGRGAAILVLLFGHQGLILLAHGMIHWWL